MHAYLIPDRCSSKLQIVSMGRKKFSADFQLMFRILKFFLFVGTVVTLVILRTLKLSIADVFASLLAFLPTGWALLQVRAAQLKTYVSLFCMHNYRFSFS